MGLTKNGIPVNSGKTLTRRIMLQEGHSKPGMSKVQVNHEFEYLSDEYKSHDNDR